MSIFACIACLWTCAAIVTPHAFALWALPGHSGADSCPSLCSHGPARRSPASSAPGLLLLKIFAPPSNLTILVPCLLVHTPKCVATLFQRAEADSSFRFVDSKLRGTCLTLAKQCGCIHPLWCTYCHFEDVLACHLVPCFILSFASFVCGLTAGLHGKVRRPSVSRWVMVLLMYFFFIWALPFLELCGNGRDDWTDPMCFCSQWSWHFHSFLPASDLDSARRIRCMLSRLWWRLEVCCQPYARELYACTVCKFYVGEARQLCASSRSVWWE